MYFRTFEIGRGDHSAQQHFALCKFAYTSFCHDIQIFVLTLGYVEKHLNKKAMVNFRIYDITDWVTLLNISKSKGNQAMKLGQLIKYSVNNFFFSKINHFLVFE